MSQTRESHRFIFVGGLHRSGTSVFFRCLAAHPDIGGFNKAGVFRFEGQHFQSIYPTDKAYGGPGKFAFHPQAHLTEASPLVSAESRQRLLAQWNAYWDVSKPYLLEKSPPNLIWTRFLQALFPTSYFIILMRHPIATSLATQKWSKTGIYSLVKHWVVSHELFEADRRHLQRVLLVRYEEFIQKPEPVLERVFAFLGLQSHVATQELRRDADQRYQEAWEALQHDGWRSRLSVHLTCRAFERRVNRFGYSLRTMRDNHEGSDVRSS